MSFLSENVIPGNHGQVFGTNAKSDQEMERIQFALAEMDGTKEVIVNNSIFPREFTIHTDKMIKVVDIEKTVSKLGLHAIPKSLFHL